MIVGCWPLLVACYLILAKHPPERDAGTRWSHIRLCSSSQSDSSAPPTTHSRLRSSSSESVTPYSSYGSPSSSSLILIRAIPVRLLCAHLTLLTYWLRPWRRPPDWWLSIGRPVGNDQRSGKHGHWLYALRRVDAFHHHTDLPSLPFHSQLGLPNIVST